MQFTCHHRKSFLKIKHRITNINSGRRQIWKRAQENKQKTTNTDHNLFINYSTNKNKIIFTILIKKLFNSYTLFFPWITHFVFNKITWICAHRIELNNGIHYNANLSSNFVIRYCKILFVILIVTSVQSVTN